MTFRDSTDPKLRVRGATKVYPTASGDLVAIDGCSLEVHAGEIVSIVGPSGCGKTTLLWAMSGLHGLTSGERAARRQAHHRPAALKSAWCSRTQTCCPGATSMPTSTSRSRSRAPQPDRNWIAQLTRRVGLEGFGTRMPRELSGGMQQRAALVRALSFKPSVLLMDEPFGALDAFTREEMNHLVEEIYLDTKTTLVLITHSIDEAIFFSDRVIVMSARPGRVAKEYEVPFPRPRSFEIMATREVFDLANAIKLDIVGEQKSMATKAQRTVQMAAQ